MKASAGITLRVVETYFRERRALRGSIPRLALQDANIQIWGFGFAGPIPYADEILLCAKKVTKNVGTEEP